MRIAALAMQVAVLCDTGDQKGRYIHSVNSMFTAQMGMLFLRSNKRFDLLGGLFFEHSGF
jgi:hypothetical protein